MTVGIGKICIGFVVAAQVVSCSGSSDSGPSGAAGAGSGTGGGGGEAGAAATATLERSDQPRDESPEVSSADYAAFISNTNQFGLDVFGELTDDEANAVFSPVSTAVALGMAYAGARGETATQMATVLHNDLPDDTFHASMNQLALDLDARNVAPHETMEGTKSVRLSLVNSSWAQKDYPLLAPFLDILATQYDAGMHLADFINDPDGSRRLINQWVATETEDRIEELIPPNGITDLTRLVLTNALYFYGTWATPFNAEYTSSGAFHTLAGSDVTADFMIDTGYYPYGEGTDYQIVDLPYDGGDLAMSVVLPEAGRFGEIRDALSSDWIEQARAAISTEQEVRVSLPKFSYTWGTESLKPALESLGMTDAFVYPTADFSGMESTRELYISEVFHQAFVAVDEDGTEAAAATAVVMTAGAIPDPPVPFDADRPFLFLIRDATGAILFVGQVLDPTA